MCYLLAVALCGPRFAGLIIRMRKYPCHGRGSKKQIDLLASNYPKKLNILAIESLLEDTKLTCMLGCQMWPPWLIY